MAGREGMTAQDVYYLYCDSFHPRLDYGLKLLLELDNSGQWLYMFAKFIAKRRVPEIEKRLLEVDTTGCWLLYYAVDVAKERIPEFECRMMDLSASGYRLCRYAEQVARCRIPEFEEWLLRNGEDLWVIRYANNILDRRIPEFEERGAGTRLKI